MIVARVEAFIAGWNVEEALKRAEAYREAGADAILMHSKKTDHSEILQFVEAWDNKLPVIIVPTKYYTTPTQTFRDWKIALVIWANHNMRAAVQAMKDTTKNIFETQSLVGVEQGGKVVPVNEIFRLQNMEELKKADGNYL